MSVQHREEKQFTLAEKLSGTGYVEARDLTEYKVALIEENIERSGLNNIELYARMRRSMMRRLMKKQIY